MDKKITKMSALNEEVQNGLTAIIEAVVGNELITIVGSDGTARTSTIRLQALKELLENEIAASRAVDAEMEKQDKAQAKEEAKAHGAVIAKDLEVGCVIRFEMGSGKNKMVFERTIIKKTDSTVHVKFDESYPCETAIGEARFKTKYIPFAKVVEIVSRPAVVAAA